MEAKRKGGASVYILAVYAIVLIIIVWLYTFQTRLINYVRDDYDSGLVMSLLGAATINVEEYGRTGQRVIHGSGSPDSCPDEHLEAALHRLQSLLATNLSSWQIVISPVTLDEFKVYNVYEYRAENGAEERQIYECTWTNGSWSEVTHGVNEAVYVYGAGERGHAEALVEDTTVYAKISFTIELYPYFPGFAEHIPEEKKTLSVSMQRSVSIPKNEGALYE